MCLIPEKGYKKVILKITYTILNDRNYRFEPPQWVRYFSETSAKAFF
jgi:hypothetical protein